MRIEENMNDFKIPENTYDENMMMRTEENMNNSKIPENTYDENMELFNHYKIPEMISLYKNEENRA